MIVAGWIAAWSALAAGPLPPQDKADEAASKALNYVRGQLKPGGSWAGFAERAFAGLAFIAEGSTPTEGEYASELAACIDYFVRGGGGSEQENWYYAIAGLFLAEAHKKWPSDDKARRLEEIVAKIKETQEPTGGWSHHKGFAYNLPGKTVPDLGIVTGLILAALGNIKAAGVEVPQDSISRGLAYCEKISDGAGLIYGTNNPVPDMGCTRGAGALIGLYFMNNRSEIFGKVARGLRERVKQLEHGHAFPPIHFFNSAVGNYLAGQYGAFKAEWVAKLLGQRESDGSIWMKNHEKIDYERNQLKSNVIGTSVLAVILLLDRDHLFKVKGKAKPKAKGGEEGNKPPDGASPFGRKKGTDKPDPVPSGGK
jgi:hypothetical protein